MKADLSLINLNHGLCEAIEKDGVICFNKKHCRGYCYKHYSRLRRLGSFNLQKKEKKCKFIDCDELFYCKDFCKKHHSQFMRRTTKKKCIVDKCNNRSTGKYCSKHKSRLLKYGTILGSGNKKGSRFKPGNTFIRQKEYKSCLARFCHRNSNEYKITKGLCPKHYQRWRKKGEYETQDIS